MKNALIIVKEETIFSKIKKFIKRIFGLNKKDEKEKNSIFKDDIKVDIKVDNLNSIQNVNSINELLKKFEKNPELVKELSDERLNKLIDYYKEIIAMKKAEIEKLKKNA